MKTNINSTNFNLKNINLNVNTNRNETKSVENYPTTVSSSYNTIADVSTWWSSSITLGSLTIGPSSVNGGLHNYGDPNTTTIGIVVSDPTILIGETAYGSKRVYTN